MWRDDVCVALIDARPLNRGHVLVVPIAEIDQWVDLDSRTVCHLMEVARRVAKAQRAKLAADRIGVMIAGFEVPHVHIHVVPVETMDHLDFAKADPAPDPDDLDIVAGLLGDFLANAADIDD